MIDQQEAETRERVGVVLAAGTGWRLLQGDAARPSKPLTPVGGVPLLYRVLAGLVVAGCARVVVVVGYAGEAIRSAVSRDRPAGSVPVAFAQNDRYELKNGVSVLAAESLVGDASEIVLAMGDHLVGDEIWSLAGAHRPPEDGATLLVDRRVSEVLDLDDATKVRTSNDRIVAIGKEIDPYDAIDVGVFVASRALFSALRGVYAARGDVSLSEGIQSLASDGKMTVLDVGDGFWQDVDDARMLAHAEAQLAARASRPR